MNQDFDDWLDSNYDELWCEYCESNRYGEVHRESDFEDFVTEKYDEYLLLLNLNNKIQ